MAVKIQSSTIYTPEYLRIANQDWLKLRKELGAGNNMDNDARHNCDNSIDSAMSSHVMINSETEWHYDAKHKKVTIEGFGPIDIYGEDVDYMETLDICEIEIKPGITSIREQAFYGCRSLSKVTLPEGLSLIGEEAFSGCTSLKDVVLPDSIRSIKNGAFSGCKSLESVVFSNNLQAIGEEAFSGCTSLKKVVLPDGISSLEFKVFYNCTSLSSIFIPRSVTSISDQALMGCNSLESIEVDVDNEVCKAEGKCLYTKDGGILLKVPSLIDNTLFTIPDGVKCIRHWAFYDCIHLNSIVIPDGVLTIENGAFSGCSSLRTFTIPSSVEKIGDWLFNGCDLLEAIDIDECNSFYKVLDGCLFTKDGKELISVPPHYPHKDYTVPEGVEVIRDGAFASCSSLESVVVPDSVSSIGAGAFYCCESLSSVTIPESVKMIRYDAFSGCISLKKVIGSSKHLREVEEQAGHRLEFQEC